MYTVAYRVLNGVNGTPFWAGNHAEDPERYGQPLRNETERSQITRFVS